MFTPKWCARLTTPPACTAASWCPRSACASPWWTSPFELLFLVVPMKKVCVLITWSNYHAHQLCAFFGTNRKHTCKYQAQNETTTHACTSTQSYHHNLTMALVIGIFGSGIDLNQLLQILSKKKWNDINFNRRFESFFLSRFSKNKIENILIKDLFKNIPLL